MRIKVLIEIPISAPSPIEILIESILKNQTKPDPSGRSDSSVQTKRNVEKPVHTLVVAMYGSNTALHQGMTSPLLESHPQRRSKRQGTTSVVPKKPIQMSCASAPATLRQTIPVLHQEFPRRRYIASKPCTPTMSEQR
jgi:hypothetical protein